MNLLEAAAEHMEIHGWTRGTSIDSNGAVCLQGALFYCSHNNINGQLSPDYPLAFRYLSNECWSRYGGSVPFVNDNIIADCFEAIDVLKHAAKAMAADPLTIC